METLVIARNNPTQGQMVNVRVSHNGKYFGSLAVPFEIWLHFEKLINVAVERLKLENPDPRLVVKFETIEEERSEPQLAKRLTKTLKEE